MIGIVQLLIVWVGLGFLVRSLLKHRRASQIRRERGFATMVGESVRAALDVYVAAGPPVDAHPAAPLAPSTPERSGSSFYGAHL